MICTAKDPKWRASDVFVNGELVKRVLSADDVAGKVIVAVAPVIVDGNGEIKIAVIYGDVAIKPLERA